MQVLNKCQIIKFAGLVFSLAPFAAVNANYIELGFELENYNGRYEDEHQIMPYVGFGLNPVEDSPLVVTGQMSQSNRYESSATRGDNRARHDLLVGYSWDFGNLTLSPMAGVRYDEFRSGSRSTEYRFVPNAKYTISNSSTIYLGGFMAPNTVKGSDRSEENTGDFKKYTDYKHELEFGLNQKLSDSSSFKIALYNEYNSWNEAERADIEEERNEWQLRLAYSKNLNDRWRISPWGRFDLYRKKEAVDGQRKQEIRHRVGFDANYKVSNEWSVKSRIYIQKEEKESWGEVHVADKYRTFLQLAVTRSF